MAAPDPIGFIGSTVAGRRCLIRTVGDPECILLQPTASFEEGLLASEAGMIADGTARGFVLAAFEIEDWNRELSPWRAPPPRGREWFGDGAPETLRFLEEDLIPSIRSERLPEGAPVVLGGYSMAGLFSLWAGMSSDSFDAVVGASPSTWMNGWTDFVRRNEWRVRAVYLSLGDTEHVTRNAMLSRARDCIEATYRSASSVDSILEWNEGGHFSDSAARTARGFSWAVGRVVGDASPAIPSERRRCCAPRPSRRRAA